MGYKEMYQDGKMTDKMKWRRIKNHYPEIFPLNEISEEKKDMIKNELNDVKFKENNIFIISKNDIIKPVLLYGVLKVNEFIEYDFYSFYEIMEKYFNDDKLTSINKNYAILYSKNISEIRNNMLPEIICQILSRRCTYNQYNWVFYQGSEIKFKKKYKNVYDFMNNKNFKKIVIEDVKKGKSKNNLDVY